MRLPEGFNAYREVVAVTGGSRRALATLLGGSLLVPVFGFTVGLLGKMLIG